MDLPTPVEQVLREAIAELARVGLHPCSCAYQPESFGDFVVRFAGSGKTIDIVRDRGQLTLDGPQRELEALGLWRVFHPRSDLLAGLRTFIAAGD